ncbi:hypothetical protein PHYSODRAFT_509535 [Phytophthora sojae]|uniref:Uncharacterized protein n=1 Tax=Phytophthora sojae (strain P6497) TaxID=1094619 RepID=G4ZMR5_PHYSP|nr:hypothetical protein PHYSODRAFT_509535 [Phytophthora sojae]EGZ16035.1 hypothetical protein PHYSODRAFT_509535 [Phytophthora sojae]|eukprot:XP_009529784.1 hypothetical protein PHYSODRAFT_509535 [Phytophthora sojae]
MGLCAARGMTAEDREQEKVAEFVRYAITSDLVKLQEMIVKKKMNPNAKDVPRQTPMGAMRCITLAERITTRWCATW